jgi:hypothetical protein
VIRIVLHLYDEANAVLVVAREATTPGVLAIQEGVQLAQVAPRKPDVYPVAVDGDEHVFSPCQGPPFSAPARVAAIRSPTAIAIPLDWICDFVDRLHFVGAEASAPAARVTK